MTTLIDRIMNKIEIDHTGKWAEDMIAIKKILEGELTAVKGVDELIEKRENTRQTLSYIASRGCVEDAGKYKQIMDCISDLKYLKQTPVASECKHECDKYVDADGVHCERCTELIEPTTEEKLKDSQTKEVCLHCKSEFNYKLPNGLCSSCNMKLIDR